MELTQQIKIENPPDVIAVSEIKPKNYKRELKETEYEIPGYEMEPENLEEKDATRGLLIYIKNSLKYTRIDVTSLTIEASELPREIMCLEIHLQNKDKMLLCNIYRSPNGSKEDDHKINNFFKIFGNTNYRHKVIFGDFNRKDINWETVSATSEEDTNFIVAVQDSFLVQHILEPTRGRGKDEPSLLDLFFSTQEEAIEEINHLAPLGKSDHSLIEVIYQIKIEIIPPKTILNYEKGDFEKMRKVLDIDWKDTFQSNGADLDEMWEIFNKLFNDAVQECIPKKVLRSSTKTVSLDNSTLRKRKQKQRLWNKYLRTKKQKNYLEYCRCRNQVRRGTRKSVKDYEKKVAKYVKTNSKVFWKHVNNRIKARAKIPDLCKKDEINGKTKDDAEKAEVLGQFFASVFVNEPVEASSESMMSKHNAMNHELKLSITKNVIRTKLDELDPSKSPGPDTIHPRVLKEVSTIVEEPLYLIFKKSIELGKVPSKWKLASVTPIYKGKGSKSLPENYRPISMTSICCRIMESIVRDSLMEYMNKNSILSERQFGFMKGRSTVLQLLRVLDQWTDALDRGNIVDVVFCDFQKAFDTVPHKKLIHVLKQYGIRDNLLLWLKDFLTDRKMEVKISGSRSRRFDVTSGVPQGSVLGPVLFIIFINSIIEAGQPSDLYLYADDLKVFREVTSAADIETLQTSLNKVHHWTCSSLLHFHPDKCHVMRLKSSRSQKQYPEGNYSIPGTNLNTVDVEKDLGIYIDNKLSFDHHINIKVKKANSLVGVLRRSFTFLDKYMFKQIFTTIVRPHLEYGAPIWSPHLRRQIILLENVQRRATKMLPGYNELSYKDRLKDLALPTLEYRRYRGDMIETYKMTHDFYDQKISIIKFRENLRSENASTAHQYSLQKGKTEKDIRTFFFKNRIVNQWNNLPKKVVEAPTLNSFKARLDKLWTINDVMYDCDVNINEITSSRKTRFIKVNFK